jgi:hypothetical protein
VARRRRWLLVIVGAVVALAAVLTPIIIDLSPR